VGGAGSVGGAGRPGGANVAAQRPAGGGQVRGRLAAANGPVARNARVEPLAI
jgi:hypothetical protein